MAAGSLVLFGEMAGAQSSWKGVAGGVNSPNSGNWNVAANWDVAPPVSPGVAGTELVFKHLNDLAPLTTYTATNNFAAPPYVFSKLTLQNDWSNGNLPLLGDILDGWSLRLVPIPFVAGPSIIQAGSKTFTIQNDLQLQSDAAFADGSLLVNGPGTLRLNGHIALNLNLSVKGAHNVSGIVYQLNSKVISGTGGITVEPDGVGSTAKHTLVLNGKNTYAGGTTLRSGTLRVEGSSNAGGAFTDGPVGTGGLVLNGGTVRTADTESKLRNTTTLAFTITFAKPTKLYLSGDSFLFGQIGAVEVTLDVVDKDSYVRFAKLDKLVAQSGLIKAGQGRVVLDAGMVHPIKGKIIVDKGRLIVHGDLGAAANFVKKVEVKDGATLGGDGFIFVDPANVTGKLTVKGFGKVKPAKKDGNNVAPVRLQGVPADIPGILTVDGGAEFEPDSSLDVQLDGPVPGSDPGFHSQLKVFGDVLIDGATLDVRLTYLPSMSDKLFVVNNDSSDPIMGSGFWGLPVGGSCTLSAVSSLNGHRYQFSVSYTGDADNNSTSGGNDVVLYDALDVASSPADVNNDGQVNIDDLVAVIRGWGECPQPLPPPACPLRCPGDVNHNAQVDIDDLTAVITAWGT